jgi:hypothetical protein
VTTAARSNEDLSDGTKLRVLPADFVRTRISLHLIAARVLGAARYAAVGRLGLIVVPGGFATPEFNGRRLLVVDGVLSDGTRRQPITTLSDAYAFAGLDPTVSPHPALDLPADPDATLVVDTDAAHVLSRWFSFCQWWLEALHTDAGVESAHGPSPIQPSPIQLWPEHFDVAFDKATPTTRVNFGGSPGDLAIDTPYLYIGPHVRPSGPFWNAEFGAALPYDKIRGGADPAHFFGEGEKLLSQP